MVVVVVVCIVVVCRGGVCCERGGDCLMWLMVWCGCERGRVYDAQYYCVMCVEM